MRTIALVGTRADGLIAGKITARVFVPIFAETCARAGFEVKVFPDPVGFLSSAEISAPLIVILVYSEVRALRWGLDATFRQVLERAQELDALVVHPPELGFAIADKVATRDLLVPAGVRMPELVTGDEASFPVLCNARVGSNEPVSLIMSGRLDRSLYNTRYVDAVYERMGARYHVCLRAMAVGATCVALYPRARLVSEGNPSVHNENTPTDPDLLNELYSRVVRPNHSELLAICQSIGSRLGPGFYAHDIVPERDTGLLYVCETGFKFDDYTWRAKASPVRDALTFDKRSTAETIAASSHAFVSSIEAHGS